MGIIVLCVCVLIQTTDTHHSKLRDFYPYLSWQGANCWSKVAVTWWRRGGGDEVVATRWYQQVVPFCFGVWRGGNQVKIDSKRIIPAIVAGLQKFRLPISLLPSFFLSSDMLVLLMQPIILFIWFWTDKKQVSVSFLATIHRNSGCDFHWKFLEYFGDGYQIPKGCILEFSGWFT